ncbi:MAG: polymer-forming cytoskeletal protein [Rikenellaceae bacterium]
MKSEPKKKDENYFKSFVKSFGLTRLEDDEPLESAKPVEIKTAIDSMPKPPSVPQKEAKVEAKPKLTAYITPGQIIDGSITVSDDMVVEGTVNGDIISSCDVLIKGTVNGNIKAENVEIFNAEVVGNIDAKFNAILFDCTVDGNIKAENIDVNGQVSGNVSANNLCSISENAVVNGDVSSKAFVVKQNALINGTINMRRDNTNTTTTPQTSNDTTAE